VISGTGYSRIGRHVDTPCGILAVEAAHAALAEAGLDPEAVDGLANFPQAGHVTAGSTDGIDFASAELMARLLRLPQLRWRGSVQPGDFASSVVAGVHAISSGACETVLVWRAMHNPRDIVYGQVQGRVASGETEFTAPYGFGDAISRFAMPYSRYLAKYGATREHMAAFIINNRTNAANNPDAVFYGRPVTTDEYLSARMIADPFSILDCDMPVDGAGAVVLTTLENAREAAYPAVYVSGSSSLGINLGTTAVVLLEDHEESAAQVAEALWANSGLGPADVDSANLYDGFSYFTYLLLEAFGFCGKGEAFEFIQGDRIRVKGAFPLNTSGGSLGMGRLHGTPQVIESVRQIQGRAEGRQISRANVVLAVTGQPQYSMGALLLTKNAA
jgi:acetyl-CoA acetyltransferase